MAKKKRKSPYSQAGQEDYAKQLRINAWRSKQSFAKLAAQLKSGKHDIYEQDEETERELTGKWGGGK